MNAGTAERTGKLTSVEYDNLVIGLGKTGMSCVRYLLASGQSVAVMDSRASPPGAAELMGTYPGVPAFLGGFREQVVARARRLVVSPGVSVDEPALRAARRSGIEAIGDVELFCRAARAPVVAVTGSNGKSTVATLVHEMLLRAGKTSLLGGNIGTPALDLLGHPVPDYYVLELSSFQLETTTSLAAQAAAVLNISPDHMDRYADVRAYAEAKLRILAGASTGVINLDDPLLAGLSRNGGRVGFTLGVPRPGEYGIMGAGANACLATGNLGLLAVREMRLRGTHNHANALAALALGRATGACWEDMCGVLRDFQGLPHRCQWVARFHEVDWYNDSKGTNVGATVAAIRGIGDGRNLVLIAGGEGKGADFSALADASADHVRHAILIGKDAQRIADALGQRVPVTFATSMQAAVQLAARLARPGDLVLLSPACASLDMFQDYRARGEEFVRALKALMAEAGHV